MSTLCCIFVREAGVRFTYPHIYMYAHVGFDTPPLSFCSVACGTRDSPCVISHIHLILSCIFMQYILPSEPNIPQGVET